MYSAYTASLIKSFVALHGADIVNSINNTGLFFPAVVGQLSVESANGTSSLAQNYNNYGGIKGDAQNGVALSTTEGNNKTASVAYFKKYDSFAEFMIDYVSNLQSDKYVNAGVFTATSPEDQITKMVEAGYSTMTPSAYLAGGVQDRIDATRDIFQLGTISSTSVADNSTTQTQTNCTPITQFNF